MRCAFFIVLLLLNIKAYSFNEDVFRFQRCYAQFTRTKIQPTHELLLKIKNNKLTGREACLSLLKTAFFNAENKIANLNSETINILRTFQSFHHTWFPSYDLNVLTGDFGDGDFFDVNEMGYHLTYSLFKPQTKFSSIVTNEGTFKALRLSEKQPVYLYDNSLGKPKKRDMMWNNGDLKDTKWQPRLKDFGQLVGIEPHKVNETFINMTWDNKLYKTDAEKSLGAGVIGSVPYLLLNSGQIRSKMDGDMKDHRRWSKAVLSDLFCKSLPVITEQDAEPYVEPKSAINFRHTAKCMQCHATIDRMAGVLRNAELFHTSDNNDLNTLRGVYVHSIKPDSKNYYEQKPKAEIIIRNYKNELVKAEVNSLADFGQWVSQQDDFYICAARRYTQFLLGDNGKALNNFIVEQGLSLKKHQSLVQMIDDILSSPYYLNRKL